MYLSNIRIENYRLLKDVDVSFDRELTLFVGKNNTGKTSVRHWSLKIMIFPFLLSGKAFF